MTEKHDENENIITHNDINTINERNNQFNVEQNRYVAEDDSNNKVDNTITMGNDYLLGTEIKVKDDVSKNKKDTSLSLYHRKYIYNGQNDERANINQNNVVYHEQNNRLIALADINKAPSEKGTINRQCHPSYPYLQKNKNTMLK